MEALKGIPKEFIADIKKNERGNYNRADIAAVKARVAAIRAINADAMEIPAIPARLEQIRPIGLGTAVVDLQYKGGEPVAAKVSDPENLDVDTAYWQGPVQRPAANPTSKTKKYLLIAAIASLVVATGLVALYKYNPAAFAKLNVFSRA